MSPRHLTLDQKELRLTAAPFKLLLIMYWVNVYLRDSDSVILYSRIDHLGNIFAVIKVFI